MKPLGTETKGNLRMFKKIKKMVSADSIEDYQKAADLKVECKLIENIKIIEEKSKDIEITIDDVAYVVEAWTVYSTKTY